MLTYYPLRADFTVYPPEQVGTDFAEVVGLAPGKPLFFMEVGYPSSPVCGSSPEQQAQFVHEVFRAWDAHAEAIPRFSYAWLTDLSPASVRDLQGYYGLSGRAFAEFLRTLGLRTWEGDGTDKPAFQQLQREARARGW